MGRTPLIYAAWQGHIKILQYLPDKKAPVDHKSRYGNTALLWTLHHESAKILVEHGADIHHANTSGKTALFNAANFNKIEMARYLISKGAKINTINKYGQTPSAWQKKKDIRKW